jgi:hypothetical protein
MTIATLTAGDLAAVIAAVVSLAAVVAIAVVLVLLVRALHEARAEVAAFRARSTQLLDRLEQVVSEAGDDLERVDDLIGSAEAHAATVDGVTRVGYLTMGKPVIKTVALAKGTSRAARRMRGTKAG